jgi:hypothetical protein
MNGERDETSGTRDRGLEDQNGTVDGSRTRPEAAAEEPLAEPELLAVAERCAELKRRIYRLTEELEVVKQELLDLGLDTGESVTAGGHRFEGRVSRRYRFSPEVEDLERELRARKDREVESGRARLAFQSRYVRISRLLEDVRAEYPRAGLAWTRAEMDLLEREAARGTSIRDIGAMLGRQPGAVRSRLARIESAEEE